MMRVRLALTLALAAAVCLPIAAQAQADKATLNMIEGYFDFVDANSGTLMAKQIAAEDYKRLFVLDVRDAGQFGKDHIPGAVNIEWREVIARRAKLPKDKTVLVYCNTSSFAGQVAMALRMDGFENVRLLHGGYNEWKARGGVEAHANQRRRGQFRCSEPAGRVDLLIAGTHCWWPTGLEFQDAELIADHGSHDWRWGRAVPFLTPRVHARKMRKAGDRVAVVATVRA